MKEKSNFMYVLNNFSLIDVTNGASEYKWFDYHFEWSLDVKATTQVSGIKRNFEKSKNSSLVVKLKENFNLLDNMIQILVEFLKIQKKP